MVIRVANNVISHITKASHAPLLPGNLLNICGHLSSHTKGACPFTPFILRQEKRLYPCAPLEYGWYKISFWCLHRYTLTSQAKPLQVIMTQKLGDFLVHLRFIDLTPL